MKFFIFLLLIISSAYSQENCGSLDKRNMVDQLDCFCGSDGQSIVQQKIDKLKTLSKALGKQNTYQCHSAIFKTLSSTKDNKTSSNISKKLKSLNYSDEQIDKSLNSVSKQINTAKLIQSGSCSKGSVSISVWPFSYKSSESAECAAINKMDPSEREAVMILAIYMNPLIKGSDSFTPQFKELDEATKLEESYSENRILKCLQLTQTIKGTTECSNSKADDNKIENCISLAMGMTNSINCLQSNAAADGIKSCKNLSMGETNTINCLQINPNDQTARACKFLGFGETNTMKCLGMKPETKIVELCKFLDFGETNTVNCLTIKPNEQVARACKSLSFGETNKINCLQIKPSTAVAESCKILNLGETNTVNCLNIKPEMNIASACKNWNFSETSTMNCLQSGATPEKIHQCGQKNLSETPTLNCLNQPFNEKPSNSQVSDIPRAPKEWTNENPESSLKLNNISK